MIRGKIERMITGLQELLTDADLFDAGKRGGVKAGTRIRKQMQQHKALARNVRTTIADRRHGIEEGGEA